jgi:hypothetical protein
MHKFGHRSYIYTRGASHCVQIKKIESCRSKLPHPCEGTIGDTCFESLERLSIKRPFTTEIDHESLKYLTTQPNLKVKHNVRWVERFHEFDYGPTMDYIKGKENIVVDVCHGHKKN